MKFLRKLFLYVSLILLIAGIILLFTGYLGSRAVFAMIRAAIETTGSQGAITALITGVFLLFAAVVLFLLSFILGRKHAKKTEKEDGEKQ